MTILTDVLSWDPATIVADLREFTTVDKHVQISQASGHLETCFPMFSSFFWITDVSHECIWSS